ncbi:MAG TPA: hypothetical protein VHY36_13330 [Steroidobacteraceae bacterium]|jgi:hypothetical protein|nr:hypothetical protein [Steroidobacteraceae bacterium]
MNRALIIGILSAGALAACSTTPSHPAVPTAAAVPAGWCAKADGTPLRPGSPGCNSVTKTYSGEQLQQTGFTDLAHALQMLDPDVTVGR